ncbi:MAG: helix-turn-helix domain-containing protein [Rhodospirillaceae bacterium]|nr:helix-turn-helix domain-containing protein [Rhodospirillaceae bacterium]MYK14502.1 helix-turn-helix domain-containing protein [Rhodospirillaceae bacterium]
MPAILTGAPLPFPEPAARPVHRDPGPEGAAGGGTDQHYIDTREAAARLGLSPSTLARYRITGEGPWYYRFGGCVRYRGDDLEAWDAGGRQRCGREAAGIAVSSGVSGRRVG